MTRRSVRLVLGLLWLVDAGLQAGPADFARGYPLGDLAQSVMGAPPWENRAVYAAISPFVPHWPWWNLGAVLVQVVLGLALLTDRWPRAAVVASVAWAAGVWLVGEGLGLLPTGFAMLAFGAPGPAVLYAALGLLAWPRAGGRDLDRRAWLGAWLAYWVGGAFLHVPWVYPAGRVLSANFEEAGLGQPGWLEAPAHAAARAVAAEPLLWSVGLAAVELAVGLGALAPRDGARWALVAAVAVAAAFWVVGQELGGMLAAGATDVGTAPLVVVLALAGWPRARPAVAYDVGAHAAREPRYGAAGDEPGAPAPSNPGGHRREERSPSWAGWS